MTPIKLAGETLTPLADRALWWPRADVLLVADVHLGKGAAFRRAGVAVPSGSSAQTLARLSALLTQTRASRLVVLGDLFHTTLSADEPAAAAFTDFRANHGELAIEAICGNHDRHVERLPAHWRIHWHLQTQVEGPFVLAHEPQPDGRGYVLAGHLHPVLRLKSANDSLRVPVFWFGAAVGVLPSFGAFTGGWPVTPTRGDRLIAVTPQGLVPLPVSPIADSTELLPCTVSSPAAPASSAPR